MKLQFWIGKLKTWSLTKCIGWMIQWHLNHCFDHITPHPENIACSTEAGVQKKTCVCTTKWVRTHHGNSTADVWRAEQKTSGALRDLPRGSLQCLQRLTLHRKKAPSIWSGAWSLYASFWNAAAAVVRSCVHCSTLFNPFMSWSFTSPPKPQMSSPLAPVIGTWQYRFFVPWNYGRAEVDVAFPVDICWTLASNAPHPLKLPARRILKLWGKQEKHHELLLQFFALDICGWFSMFNLCLQEIHRRSRKANKEPLNHNSYHEIPLQNICTHFANFSNGPVVKGRVRVWHIVQRLCSQDVLRVVGVAYPWCGV